VSPTIFGERSGYIRNLKEISVDEETGEEISKYKVIVFSAIDTLNYKEVGFKVSVGEASMQNGSRSVYTLVIAKDELGNTVEIKPGDFGGNSTYIFRQIHIFPDSYKDKSVKYQPYAIDMNGNYIYGEEKTIDMIYNR
ncbi:MAG: hypothetical protein IJN97_03485, partial [Oscillospiraceae bacterium]|nr:hypothetical protein [Oscillospiraceae bacterium]